MKHTIPPTTLLNTSQSDAEINDASPVRSLHRRSFLRNLGLGAALLAPGAGLLSGAGTVLAGNGKGNNGNGKGNGKLTKGDVAILQFLAAAEIIETDLWQQYTELG